MDSAIPSKAGDGESKVKDDKNWRRWPQQPLVQKRDSPMWGDNKLHRTWHEIQVRGGAAENFSYHLHQDEAATSTSTPTYKGFDSRGAVQWIQNMGSALPTGVKSSSQLNPSLLNPHAATFIPPTTNKNLPVVSPVVPPYHQAGWNEESRKSTGVEETTGPEIRCVHNIPQQTPYGRLEGIQVGDLVEVVQDVPVEEGGPEYVYVKMVRTGGTGIIQRSAFRGLWPGEICGCLPREGPRCNCNYWHQPATAEQNSIL